MDGSDDLLEQMSKITGIKPTPLPKPVTPKIKPTAGLDVPAVLDDEFSKLGYSPNARLALLSNVGRENNWNSDIIFGGHSDPANQAFNRGIISWQKDRQTKLDKFVRSNGGDFTPNESNLRLQARFLDKELNNNRDWSSIQQRLKSNDLSLDEAYPLLQKYIKYQPRYENDNKAKERILLSKGYTPKQIASFDTSEADNLLAQMQKVTGKTNIPDTTDADNLLAQMQKVTGVTGMQNAALNVPAPVETPQAVTKNSTLSPQEQSDIALGSTPGEFSQGKTDFGADYSASLAPETLPNYQEYLKALGDGKTPAEDTPENRVAFNKILQSTQTEAQKQNDANQILRPQNNVQIKPTGGINVPQNSAATQAQTPTVEPDKVNQESDKSTLTPETTLSQSVKTDTSKGFTDFSENYSYRPKNKDDLDIFVKKQIERTLLDKVSGATGADIDAVLKDSSFNNKFKEGAETTGVTVPASLQQSVAEARDKRLASRDALIKSAGRQLDLGKNLSEDDIKTLQENGIKWEDLGFSEDQFNQNKGTRDQIYNDYLDNKPYGDTEEERRYNAEIRTMRDLGEISSEKAWELMNTESLRQNKEQREQIRQELKKSNRSLYTMDKGFGGRGQIDAGADFEPSEAEIDKEQRAGNLLNLSHADVKESETVGKNAGVLSSGIIGGGGRTLTTAAGILRPFSSLGILPEDWYTSLAKTGKKYQNAESVNAEENPGVTSSLIRMAGGLPSDLGRLALLSRLPGGAVIGFAADSGLQSAGRNETANQIAGQTLKGAGLGAAFGAGNKAASVLGAKGFGQLIQQGAKIGIIAGGTAAVEKLSGASNEQALHSALVNTLFEVVGHVPNAFGKVYRVWKGGEPNDVYIDKSGNVLQLDKVEDNLVDAEVLPKEEVQAARKETEQPVSNSERRQQINELYKLGYDSKEIDKLSNTDVKEIVAEQHTPADWKTVQADEQTPQSSTLEEKLNPKPVQEKVENVQAEAETPVKPTKVDVQVPEKPTLPEPVKENLATEKPVEQSAPIEKAETLPVEEAKSQEAVKPAEMPQTDVKADNVQVTPLREKARSALIRKAPVKEGLSGERTGQPTRMVAPKDGEILSEKAFHKKYEFQHKDMRSTDAEGKRATAQKISTEGFNEGSTNILPTWQGDSPYLNPQERHYGNRKGDMVYIVPRSETIQARKIKGGWKPSPSEIVEIQYDGQPTYEAYVNQLKGDGLRKIADNNTPENAKYQRNLNDAENVLDLLPEVSAKVDKDTLKLSLEAGELMRSASAVIGDTELKSEPNISGQFLNPSDVAKYREVLSEFKEVAKENNVDPKPIDDLIKSLDTAAKENGTVLLNVFDESVPHERFHQIGYLSAGEYNKSLTNRVQDFEKFTEANSDVLQKAHDNFFIKHNYDGKKDLDAIVEETATYIATGDYEKLGLTPTESASYLLNWFDAYEHKNGSDSLKSFHSFVKGMDLAENAINEVYEQRKANKSENDANGQKSKQKPVERKTDSTDGKAPRTDEESGRLRDERADKERLTPSKVAKSIEANAVEKQLTEAFDGVAGYTKISVKEQAQKAADLINNDLERTKKIINGDEPLPSDLRGAALITAVEAYAQKAGDVGLLRDLANSPLAAETSVHGQELRLLAERRENSPIAKIQEIEAARKEARERRGGDAEKRLAENEKKLADLQAKVDLIGMQKENFFDRAEKIVKKLDDRAELARERLKKRGNVFQAGIDPVALKDLAEIGASHIGRIGLDFAKWSTAMIKEFGENIKPHLDNIWQKSQDNIKESPIDKNIEGYRTKLKNQIESLESQIAKKERLAKTPQDRKYDDETQALIDKRDSLNKDLDRIAPKDKTPPTYEQKLKVRKESLAAQIDKLQKQIDENQRVKTPTAKLPLDKDGQILAAKRDILKKELDTLIPVERTAAQKLEARKKALETQIESLETQIQTRQKAVKRPPASLDAEGQALFDKRSETRARYDEVFGKGLTNEQKLAAIKKRANERIADLKTRLTDPDYEPKKIDPTELDAEATKLKAQADTLKKLVDKDKLISDDEIKTILDLSNNAVATKVVRDETVFREDYNPSKESQEDFEKRMAYGYAQYDLSNFIAEIKKDTSRTTWRDFKNNKIRTIYKGVTGIPGQAKGLKAAFDNSAIFRQGWKTMFTNPRIWFKNSYRTFFDIANTLRGKEVDRELGAEIISRPNYELMKKAKLDVGVREEAYPTAWPEKIPALGRVYKASENAYGGFLQKTRADIFDKYIDIAKRTDVDLNDTQLKQIGRLVNSLTGRGDLGGWEKAGQTINNVFFSPKFLKSHIDTLIEGFGITGGSTIMELKNGEKGSNFVRKQAALNLAKIIIGNAAIIGIAKAVAPNSVTLDPRSSDFGKIRIGDTRFDITGGMGSLAVLAARLATQESKSGGKITEINALSKSGNSNPMAKSGLDVFEDFFENKTSPVAGAAIETLLNRKTRSGYPLTNETKLGFAGREAVNLFAPLPLTNIVENLSNKNSAPFLLNLIADGLGIAANTYSSEKDIQNQIKEAEKTGDMQEVERLQKAKQQVRDSKKANNPIQIKRQAMLDAESDEVKAIRTQLKDNQDKIDAAVKVKDWKTRKELMKQSADLQKQLIASKK